ncbi:MAG: glutamate--tRNA ligase [Chloroflexi bacterium]|nr:glutamate--tRNA ligase [Chloroflexota bacterium]MBM4454016.1 glutamate--tRNA ligase [Chloroflexota bacterium]
MSSEVPVRVRFAPSPTGFPHLGNIRTALFNWLFARHHGGVFILRIEDTDVARMVEGATESILHSLKWLGLDWDEGPIFQSQRLDIYRGVSERLLKEGMAYHCYCSPQRLEEMRKEQMKRKQPPGYDRHCRNLTQEQKNEFEARGIVPVVRFKSPLGGQTSFPDLLRGEIVFGNSTLDDFVLLKSDGYPTYHLANIADDHDMEISHVLRADEWLSSTPRHILLYQALGWQPPQFAHLPMILGPDKSKLSKRHGATSVTEYEQQGYLPEALLNFLALLGWSLDDKTEIMSRDTIIENFSLERISKTAAVFNRDKLEWMNGVYIRSLNTEEFSRRTLPFLESSLPSEVSRPLDAGYVGRIIPLIQERARTLAEVPELTDFFFVDRLDYDSSLLLNKMEQGTAVAALRASIDKVEGLSNWAAMSLESVFRPLAEELKLKTGVFFGLLRVAVTGRTAAPPLFQTIEVLGEERCVRRLKAAMDKLKR